MMSVKAFIAPIFDLGIITLFGFFNSCLPRLPALSFTFKVLLFFSLFSQSFLTFPSAEEKRHLVLRFFTRKAGQEDIFYQIHVEKGGPMCLGNHFFFFGKWAVNQQVDIHLSVSPKIFFNLHIDMHPDIYGYIYMGYVLYIFTQMGLPVYYI